VVRIRVRDEVRFSVRLCIVSIKFCHVANVIITYMAAVYTDSVCFIIYA